MRIGMTVWLYLSFEPKKKTVHVCLNGKSVKIVWPKIYATGYANHGKTCGKKHFTKTIIVTNYIKLSFIHHAKSIGPCLLLKSTSPDSQIRATLFIGRNYLTIITKLSFRGPFLLGQNTPHNNHHRVLVITQGEVKNWLTPWKMNMVHLQPSPIFVERKMILQTSMELCSTCTTYYQHPFYLQSIHLTRRFLFVFVPSHITSLCSSQLWVGLLRADGVFCNFAIEVFFCEMKFTWRHV